MAKLRLRCIRRVLRTISSRVTVFGNRMVHARSFKISFRRVSLRDETYFVPWYARHRPASRSLINQEVYEPMTHDLVRAVAGLRPGTMVHAGTFFGDMLPTFGQGGSSRVFAFEPVLENYVLSRLCVQQNQLENVVLFHAALDNRVGNCWMSTVGPRGEHAGGSSRVSNDGSGQIVPTMTLDVLGIEDLTFLHLDVEGSEAQVLEGGAATIMRCRPVIALEDNSAKTNTLLRNLGYRFIVSIPGLHLWIPDDEIDSARKLKDALFGGGEI